MRWRRPPQTLILQKLFYIDRCKKNLFTSIDVKILFYIDRCKLACGFCVAWCCGGGHVKWCHEVAKACTDRIVAYLFLFPFLFLSSFSCSFSSSLSFSFALSLSFSFFNPVLVRPFLFFSLSFSLCLS